MASIKVTSGEVELARDDHEASTVKRAHW